MNDERPDDERTGFRGEAPVYCYDFKDYPEVAGGGVLTNPVLVVSGGSAALVTLGSPFVLTSDFVEKDANGLVQRTVPSGKGVKALHTFPAVGGAKGDCTVTCTVSVDGGPPGGTRIAKRCKFTIK